MWGHTIQTTRRRQSFGAAALLGHVLPDVDEDLPHLDDAALSRVALRFHLDTNVFSALARNPAVPRIAAVDEGTSCTSIIVPAKRRFGAANSGSARRTDRVDAILSALEIRKLEAPIDCRRTSLAFTAAGPVCDSSSKPNHRWGASVR